MFHINLVSVYKFLPMSSVRTNFISTRFTSLYLLHAVCYNDNMPPRNDIRKEDIFSSLTIISCNKDTYID